MAEETIKQIADKIRAAIQLNPKVEIRADAKLINRINAEWKRQRAGLKMSVSRTVSTVAQRSEDDAKKARNARRNARKKAPEQLRELNKGPRSATPGRAHVPPRVVHLDELEQREALTPSSAPA